MTIGLMSGDIITSSDGVSIRIPYDDEPKLSDADVANLIRLDVEYCILPRHRYIGCGTTATVAMILLLSLSVVYAQLI